jgi:hypothetical protein
MMTVQDLQALVALLNRFSPQMTEIERLWLQIKVEEWTPKQPTQTEQANDKSDGG